MRVFRRLAEAGSPDAAARAAIYEELRAETAAHFENSLREQALADLEKAIRRHEVQALYEETLRAPRR